MVKWSYGVGHIFAGWRSKKSGYESLVEVATMASRNLNQIKQREAMIEALQRAFPRPILSLVNPPSLPYLIPFLDHV